MTDDKRGVKGMSGGRSELIEITRVYPGPVQAALSVDGSTQFGTLPKAGLTPTV